VGIKVVQPPGVTNHGQQAGQSHLACVSIGARNMVVHLLYTELLNADSTPQAAKTIWKISVNAGIPRYAEIVCFSDDHG